jgi:hypothetical protein
MRFYPVTFTINQTVRVSANIPIVGGFLATVVGISTPEPIEFGGVEPLQPGEVYEVEINFGTVRATRMRFYARSLEPA